MNINLTLNVFLVKKIYNGGNHLLIDEWYEKNKD